jgi:hypothetical protein
MLVIQPHKQQSRFELLVGYEESSVEKVVGLGLLLECTTSESALEVHAEYDPYIIESSDVTRIVDRLLKTIVAVAGAER